jgi:hypothetical protein
MIFKRFLSLTVEKISWSVFVSANIVRAILIFMGRAKKLLTV